MPEINYKEIILQQTANCKAALKAAEVQKECLEDTKKTVFEAAKEHAIAYIPAKEIENFINEIKKTPCAAPQKDDMKSVLQTSLNEIGPEITYKRVITINGKKLFWIGAAIFVVTVFLWGLYFCKMNKFDGTAEDWANRMYVASKELLEKNPGASYDEIMTDFAQGNAEKAKEKVIMKENCLEELQNHRGKFEKKISDYLANEFPSGVRIAEYKEEKKYMHHTILVLDTKIKYEYVFMKAVSVADQTELRIVLERQWCFPLSEPWNIHVTKNAGINSVDDYLRKKHLVKWVVSEERAIH